MSQGEPISATGGGEPEDADSPSRTGLPPPFRKRVERFLQMGMTVSRPTDSLLEKLDPTHLTTIIDNAENDSKREHELQKDREWYSFWKVPIIVLAVLIVCWLFLEYERTEHLDAVVTGVLGLDGGYGYGIAKGSRKSGTSE